MGPENELKKRWVKTLPEHYARWFSVRLGEIHDKEFARIKNVMLRYADLIYLGGEIIHIVEFKIKPDPKAIGQLLAYKQEFGRTVEFEPYWNNKVNLILLTTMHDRVVEELAEKENIIYIIYK